MSSLEERVKKIVSERLGVTMEMCVPTASLVNDLGANPDENDDLDELFIELEQEFDVEFPTDPAETMLTVGDIVSHLKANGAQ